MKKYAISIPYSKKGNAFELSEKDVNHLRSMASSSGLAMKRIVGLMLKKEIKRCEL